MTAFQMTDPQLAAFKGLTQAPGPWVLQPMLPIDHGEAPHLLVLHQPTLRSWRITPQGTTDRLVGDRAD